MKTLNVAAFGALVSWISRAATISFDTEDCEHVKSLVLDAVNVPEAETPKADPNLIKSLLWAMKDGRKIDAIKCHRMLTGYGLKESKDAIEADWPDNSVEMRLRNFVGLLATDQSNNTLGDWKDSANKIIAEINGG